MVYSSSMLPGTTRNSTGMQLVVVCVARCGVRCSFLVWFVICNLAPSMHLATLLLTGMILCWLYMLPLQTTDTIISNSTSVQQYFTSCW